MRGAATFTATMMHWFTVYTSIGWLIRIAMVPIILRRQMAPGASVAWLGIVFLHPYIGVALYLLVGETRLGPNRVERHREMVGRFRNPGQAMKATVVGRRPNPQEVNSDAEHRDRALELPALYEPMVLQAEKISGMPVLGCNSIEFLDTSEKLVSRLIQDIESAASHVHLLYYTFAPDSTGERVVEALLAAHGAALPVACWSMPSHRAHSFTRAARRSAWRPPA